MVAGTVLLRGTVGSHAYGMAREDSDIDTLGVYAAPTTRFHGLHPPTGKQATTHTTNPDVTLHEAGKFAALALACNPTILELLYLPKEFYQSVTPLGEHLISMRRRFLSTSRVRDAYLGYATQQFKRLQNAGRFPNVPVSRISKHGRHLLRLVEQGTNLWVTGELQVKAPDAQRVFDFGERVVADPDIAMPVLARAEHTFQNCRTELPAEPDERAVTEWLLAVRAEHYIPAAPLMMSGQPLGVVGAAPYVRLVDAPEAFLVDVDGTLALRGDRDPYDETTVLDDEPNLPVIKTVRALMATGWEPVFMSGRTEGCRRDTEVWIVRHLFHRRMPVFVMKNPIELHMRAVGDQRPDHVVKLELFNQHIRHDYNVRLAIDDRNQVVKLWRSLGITCMQVAEGNF